MPTGKQEATPGSPDWAQATAGTSIEVSAFDQAYATPLSGTSVPQPMCWSEQATLLPGPRGLSQHGTYRLFDQEWRVESIVDSYFETNPNPHGWTSKDAACWLASIQRLYRS